MPWKKFISAGIRLPFYMNMWLEGLQRESGRLGLKVDEWISVTDQQLTAIYFHSQNESVERKWISGRLNKPDGLAGMLAIIQRADAELLTFCRVLNFYDYGDANQSDLERLLKKFVLLFTKKFGLYAFPKIIGDALTEMLPGLIRVRLSEADLSVLLTTAERGEYERERLGLLGIAQTVASHNLGSLFSKSDEEVIEQLGRFYPVLYSLIENYVREFNWVPVNHHVQPLNLNLALASIRASLADFGFAAEFGVLSDKPEKIAAERKKILAKHEFSATELIIIDFLRGINAANDSRKAAMSKALLWSYPLFLAIADKAELDVISLRQLNHREMIQYLKYKKYRPGLGKIIKERFDFYFCLLRKGKITDGCGSKAREMINRLLALEENEVRELKGAVAYRGTVKGRVKLIRIEYQIQNLKEGEILVTSMTDPNMVPAMKRAAAIVTDEGGLLCHAAIVARELKKPCVIGTKIATRVFKDGDLVEVDADHGMVRKL